MKRSGFKKKKTKPMKRGRLHKLSPIGKLQRECDKLMQEIGKKIHPHSIISGNPTEVHHHFVPKSVCTALRYDWDNLIPLTNAEHCRLHQSPDPDIEMRIAEIKGVDWYKALQAKRRQTIKVNREYYTKVYKNLLLTQSNG